MLADVMKEHISFDKNTNETIREWKVEQTIKCQVIPFIGGGVRGLGTREVFSETYKNYDYLRLKSSVPLSKRGRVTNIRNARSGIVIWTEISSDQAPTMYDIDGSAPSVNPLTGMPMEWETGLSRAEVQN